jgi:oligopeptide/dipeptide ABC transporter ATP-binding protein
VVEVRNLVVHFPIVRGVVFRRTEGVVQAVDDVSFSIGSGETLGLVGESGSGKSTTGRAILQLLRPTAGSIRLLGDELTDQPSRVIRAARRRMQIIFQDPFASLDPHMKVGNIVREPLDIFDVGSNAERSSRVRELLALVGLQADFADRYPHEFSGGQRQRIGIARAVALQPAFIVCDEPVSALDVSIQAQVINLLEELQDRFQIAYLFIAHDLAVVRHIADRVAVMYMGEIVEIARRDDIYARPSHPYTQALLSAVPTPDPPAERRRKRIILAGDIPSPAHPPVGCRFHTRCWLREQLGRPATCVEERPRLHDLDLDHSVACHFADPAPTSPKGTLPES